MDDIQRRKNEKLVDKVFREPERSAIQKENREREEAEQLKQLEARWNPWIEKAMQRENRREKNVISCGANLNDCGLKLMIK